MNLSPSPAATLLLLICLAAGATAQTDRLEGEETAAEPVAGEYLSTPASPEVVLATSGPDTLRTNLQVAEALMGEAMQSVLPALPPPPAAMILIPGSTEQAAVVTTNVATRQFTEAGYTVYLEQGPVDSVDPVYEFRFRVENLQLAYPETGRRLLFWKSWVGRQMDLALQVTVTDAEGQVLVSRRQAHGYQDRVPVDMMEAVESPTYEFTQAETEPGKTSRRVEQVVVLGALAALVAVYFANTE